MGGCCFHWIYVVVILMPLRQVPGQTTTQIFPIKSNSNSNNNNHDPFSGLRRFVDATTCVLNGNICENKLRQMA